MSHLPPVKPLNDQLKKLGFAPLKESVDDPAAPPVAGAAHPTVVATPSLGAPVPAVESAPPAPAVAAPAVAAPAAPVVAAPVVAAPVAEARIKAKLMRVGGRYKKVRSASHLSGSERSAKRRENKKYRKSSTGRKHARVVKTNSRFKRRAAALAQAHARTESDETLENVKKLAEALRTNVGTMTEGLSTPEACRGFANIALATDALSEKYADLAEVTQSDEYADLSELYSEMSEDANDSAQSLTNLSEADTKELDTEEIGNDFSEMLSLTLEGADILVGALEEGEDCDDDDEEDKDKPPTAESTTAPAAVTAPAAPVVAAPAAAPVVAAPAAPVGQ